jgi:hypothetical protein
MARARYQRTPEVAQAITSYIRAGGYPHVAAEAAGVPGPVFEEWLQRGRKKKARAVDRDFADSVRQAKAQARLSAEVAVLKARPLDWLRSGPGKETASVPGWTGNVRAATGSAGEVVPAEFQRVIAQLMDVLAPFPEARAAAAHKLVGMGPG